MHMTRRVLLAITAIAALTVGCSSTVTHVQRGGAPRARARWVMVPFANHSETPQAGERAEAMLATVLRSRGLPSLDAYGGSQKEDEARLVASDQQRFEEAMSWARTQKYEYAVAGSIEEWRYKAGVDAEPAVGVSVRVIEVANGRVVWSSSGSKTGGGGDSVSGTALKLIDAMVKDLELGQ